MIISHYGGEMFKITSGDLTIAINPISKKSKLKPVKFGSDIAIVSRLLPEFNGTEEVTRKEKQPFIIDGPGEYEIKNVFIKGTPAKSEYQSEGINTIYTIKMENINMVFIGALSDSKPDMSFIEDMDDIDIVFVPIGDDGVLNFAEAHKFAVSLEPKVIIPMHFEGVGKKDSLKNFLKEAGSDAKPVEKLTIKKKDLEDKSAEVIVIKS